QDELTDFLPLAHTVFFTRDSIGIPTVPLFFIAAAKSLTPCRHAEPTPEDYSNGISMAQRAGIFRRTFGSPFGQRTVVCPFSGAGVKWLKLDLGGAQDSKDSAIAACIQKIRAEKESSKRVRRVCEAIEGAMEKVMTRSSTSRMDAIEGQAGTRPACPYKKQMP
ncbi:MAG: hypothetical protein HYU57_01180, partial [Micavibrio aeruginosavorus]|nr:hypothetical protein [Micavibrio aeruginosavorus]